MTIMIRETLSYLCQLAICISQITCIFSFARSQIHIFRVNKTHSMHLPRKKDNKYNQITYDTSLFFPKCLQASPIHQHIFIDEMISKLSLDNQFF